MSRLEVAKVDRFGPAISLKSVINVVADELNSEGGTYLSRGVKNMSSDMQHATKTLTDAERMLDTAIEKYNAKAVVMSTTAKKCSGDVRKAADDLASGLAKVEKAANFNNLERYVNLLERAATAMQTLAELEKAGKLEKIAGALK